MNSASDSPADLSLDQRVRLAEAALIERDLRLRSQWQAARLCARQTARSSATWITLGGVAVGVWLVVRRVPNRPRSPPPAARGGLLRRLLGAAALLLPVLWPRMPLPVPRPPWVSAAQAGWRWLRQPGGGAARQRR